MNCVPVETLLLRRIGFSHVAREHSMPRSIARSQGRALLLAGVNAKIARARMDINNEAFMRASRNTWQSPANAAGTNKMRYLQRTTSTTACWIKRKMFFSDIISFPVAARWPGVVKFQSNFFKNKKKCLHVQYNNYMDPNYVHDYTIRRTKSFGNVFLSFITRRNYSIFNFNEKYIPLAV